MIIHGKNVEFAFYTGIIVAALRDPQVEEFYSQKLKEYGRRNTKLKDYKQMYESYEKGRIDEFLYHVINLIESIITVILNKKPELIVSDNLKIHIVFRVNLIGTACEYNIERSNNENIYLNVNLILFLVMPLKNPKILYSTFHHELLHHLDKERINILNVNLYKSLNRYEDGVSPSSYFLIGILNRLRAEGLVEFSSNFEHHKKIEFDKSMEILLERIGKMSNLVNTGEQANIFSELNSTGIFHRVGEMMTSIIVLSDLFSNRKEYSAWIKIPIRFILFKRDINALQIKKYYGKRNFELFFVEDDKEVNSVVQQLLKSLFDCNHLQFLKYYEDSCKKLGVEPFLTIELYNNLKRKALENYKKFKDVGKS